MITKEKTAQELKSFGQIMALILFVLGGLFLWRHKPSYPIFLVLGSFFVLSSIFAPTILRPIEKYWMILGEKMGMVMTTILLSLTYFIIMTPMGIIMRIAGKDLLSLKLDRSAKTYWLATEKDGPSSRPFLPY